MTPRKIGGDCRPKLLLQSTFLISALSAGAFDAAGSSDADAAAVVGFLSAAPDYDSAKWKHVRARVGLRTVAGVLVDTRMTDTRARCKHLQCQCHVLSKVVLLYVGLVCSALHCGATRARGAEQQVIEPLGPCLKWYTSLLARTPMLQVGAFPSMAQGSNVFARAPMCCLPELSMLANAHKVVALNRRQADTAAPMACCMKHVRLILVECGTCEHVSGSSALGRFTVQQLHVASVTATSSSPLL